MPDNVTKNFSRISPELYNAHNNNLFIIAKIWIVSLETRFKIVFLIKISLSPLIGQDPPIAYTEGLKLIRDAKYRIVLSQKTSILVLGPRKREYGRESFFMRNFSIGYKLNVHYQCCFVHYFSLEETIKAIKNR